MDATRVRKNLQDVQGLMYDANLRLNELQLYVETSRQRAGYEEELQQRQEIIESQAKEIDHLKDVISSYENERLEIQRMLQRTNGEILSDESDESSETTTSSPFFSSPSPPPPPPLSPNQSKRHKADTVTEIICKKCDNLAFATQFSYDRHVRTMHERKFRFPCNSCCAGFETAARLSAHLQRVHNVTCL